MTEVTAPMALVAGAKGVGVGAAGKTDTPREEEAEPPTTPTQLCVVLVVMVHGA